MSKSYRRRSGHHYDRRRSHSRGHQGRGYGHHDRRHHGRHEASPLTRALTTLALWALVIIAIANGAITFTGK